jgi:hypothetical protein
MTLEEKKKVLTNIQRYRERKRQASQALISSLMPVTILVAASN